MATRRYRYRAELSGGQRKAAARLFGCARVVWNDALRLCLDTYEQTGAKPSAAELSALLTASKKIPDRVWLGEVSAVVLQQSLADLNTAYSNYFNSVKGKRRGPRVGTPRFKKKTSRQAVRFTRNARFSVWHDGGRWGRVRLPGLGWVRFRWSRDLPSNPSSVTLTGDPDGRYHLSFVVSVGDPTPTVLPDRGAGVDVGLTDLAAVTYSDGTREKITNPRWAKAGAQRLARAQRKLARTQKGSKNRAKARRRVAAIHRKIADARNDHHRKLARRLAHENQVVVVEGLNIRGLGRTRLARSIHDAGWGTLLRHLNETATVTGCRIVVADRMLPSSQTCAVCGVRDGRKPLDVREWTCPTCGGHLDRDYNAAVNLMMVDAGLAQTLNAGGRDVRHTLACAVPRPTGHKQAPAEQTTPPRDVAA